MNALQFTSKMAAALALTLTMGGCMVESGTGEETEGQSSSKVATSKSSAETKLGANAKSNTAEHGQGNAGSESASADIAADENEKTADSNAVANDSTTSTQGSSASSAPPTGTDEPVPVPWHNNVVKPASSGLGPRHTTELE